MFPPARSGFSGYGLPVLLLSSLALAPALSSTAWAQEKAAKPVGAETVAVREGIAGKEDLTPANKPADQAGKDEKDAKDEPGPVMLGPVQVYGTLDAMLYNYTVNGDRYINWNLNGVRETTLGFRTPEAEDPKRFRVVAQVEYALGADRGDHGREYTLESRQIFGGVAGKYGQLTVGQHYNVMTNIAWSQLNPVGQNWGSYWNDLLYLGDTFESGAANRASVGASGSNWFYGFLQRGVSYQFKGQGYSVMAEYAPGVNNETGSLSSIGGTVEVGKMTLAGAWSRQTNHDDSGRRTNYVIGANYPVGDFKFYLSHMASRTSEDARYSTEYGGVGWQALPKLHLSAGFARYRQNGNAAMGSGHSNGMLFLAEYALNKRWTLYVEADQRRHFEGYDGLQMDFTGGSGRETNLMTGFYYSF